jgi:propanol-preferring alcohol dehydrogenase
MKAMRLVAEGHSLGEQEVTLPAPGPRAAVVKVSAAGVCHSDIHLISGAYDLGGGRKLSTTGGGSVLPLTPGHEVAGRIESLGADALSSGCAVGDPVVVYPWIGCGACRECASGKENLCEGNQGFLGFMRDGGYAEYVLVPDARYLVRSTGVEAPQAATLACAGITALNSVERCRLRPDDLLVVIGAGGVGSTAIQIAKRVAHARVAAVDLDDSKLNRASQLGADYTFNTSKIEAKELLSQTRALHHGRGADAVVDFVGIPRTSSLGFRLLAREGRLVEVGLAGGEMTLPLPLVPLLAAEILGSFTGTLAQLVDVVRLARERVIDPVVSRSYRLEEANEVLAKLEHGEIEGRATLRP